MHPTAMHRRHGSKPVAPGGSSDLHAHRAEPPAARDGQTAELTLAFDDNRFASLLFGQYDQNIAKIERRLGVAAHANGNHVTLKGPRGSLRTGAARSRNSLCARQARAGGEPRRRRRRDPGERPAGQPVSQGGRGRRAARVRPRQDPQARRGQGTQRRAGPLSARLEAHTNSSSPRGRRAPARPGSPSATPSPCSSRASSSGSILSRPAVEAGERLGFLPGDMRDKVDPYLRPDLRCLARFHGCADGRARHADRHDRSRAAGLHARPHADQCLRFCSTRRRTRPPMQMKMFLTRLGEGSRMIVNGDPSQTDLPPGQKSGLERGDPAARRARRDRPCRASATATSCATISCAASSTAYESAASTSRDGRKSAR